MKEIEGITPEVIVKSMKHSSYPEWFSWEPETLRSEFRLKSEKDYNTLIATASLVSQAYSAMIPWNRSDVFGAICVAFDGNIASNAVWQKPSLAQILYTTRIMNMIKPQKLKSVQRNDMLSQEVKVFIASCLVYESIIHCPPLNPYLGSIDRVILKMMKDFEFSGELQTKVAKSLSDKNKMNHELSKEAIDSTKIQVARIQAEIIKYKQRVFEGKKQLDLLKA